MITWDLQRSHLVLSFLVPESISRTFDPTTKIPTLKKRKNIYIWLARLCYFDCLEKTVIDNCTFGGEEREGEGRTEKRTEKEEGRGGERRKKTARGPKSVIFYKVKAKMARAKRVIFFS